MTPRARRRRRAALVLMAVALACVPADTALAVHGLHGWRWLTLPTIGGCSALALHLRGWAAGYQAAQPRPIPDERTSR